MGNDHAKERRRALLPPNPKLQKGYSAYYHRISSFPQGMEKTKCIVVNHTPDYKFYDLRDDKDKERFFLNIPYLYVSGCRDPYTWYDYFKIGTVVATTLGNVANGNKPRDAEIVDIRPDPVTEVIVDLKDLKTGFTTYGVSPSKFYFNIEYYKDW